MLKSHNIELCISFHFQFTTFQTSHCSGQNE